MTEAPAFIGIDTPRETLRQAIAASYRRDEAETVRALLQVAQVDAPMRSRIAATARKLVEQARLAGGEGLGLDAFLGEYALSSEEGVVLMCLAEALLRIPDDDTRDRLIRDKLSEADWERHLGHSGSILVNASTVGLLLTGRVVRLGGDAHDLAGMLGRLVARAGEPVIRAALVQAMRIMGQQFVMGRTIADALARADKGRNRLYRYSFDMLGEAALTARDAERYFDAYAAAIAAIGATANGKDTAAAPGISVKLSALHPRYVFAQRERVMRELVPLLGELAALARDAGVAMTVDAEEADRLDLSLDVFEAVFREPGFDGWDGFGIAVQAYQKRALAVLDWLAALAADVGRRVPVRLVKGAYWDSEIKRAQEQGLDFYPVFTRKTTTDASYIACVRRLFADRRAFRPQFATHNAHSVATVLALAPDDADFEFQRLHGMGEALYDPLVAEDAERRVACRVYAPVGSHEDLLPYLVRRLLENGANTSFVNRLADREAPVDALIADPVEATAALTAKPHPRIPLPRDILPGRKAAAGIDLSDPLALAPLAKAMDDASRILWHAGPVVSGTVIAGEARDVTDPADRRRVVGKAVDATLGNVDAALAAATLSAADWDRLGGDARAAILARAGDLLEGATASLMALAVREGGKTIADALADVREAVDYCRYYAGLARAQFAAPLALPGPTGERNQIALHGRGVFACISPWNFPVAIFTGQVVAALAAGNAVAAKPAEQTPLCAAAVVRLLHRAGVPGEVLHLLPGDGTVGAALVEDERVSGVAFTGSTETAQAINRALAARAGPIAPLIAETGGQNAMIVDSSALPEQVVRDVIASAFLSAGQRCSALRVLFLQEETAPRIIDMLTGAMAELAIGDPGLLATDIGPVIDDDARQTLLRHAQRMTGEGRLLHRCDLPLDAAHGTFFPPMAFEIDRLSRLEREVFGPILHVIRWRAGRLDDVIDAVNATGYGLTAGIHSRIDDTAAYVHARLRAGNAYVNRSVVGAVVGVQPFGGEGLSGTGPKAGGPHYLLRFAVERTLSVNTAAVGGNATLLAQSGDEPG